jgi:hypothetical protein
MIISRLFGVALWERKSVMNKNTHADGDVIELGLASVETKGGGELILDSVSTEQNFAGLSDD